MTDQRRISDYHFTSTELAEYLDKVRAAWEACRPPAEQVTDALLREVIDFTWGYACEDGSVPSSKIINKIIAEARQKITGSQGASAND